LNLSKTNAGSPDPESSPRELHAESAGGGAVLRSILYYLAAGLISLLVDLAVFKLLVSDAELLDRTLTLPGLHPLAANAVSRPIGGLVCFFLNKHWTFKSRGRKASGMQFLSFWAVWAVSWTLSEILIWLFHEILHWSGFSSKLLAECIVVAFNYLCLRFWTFR
jgi:putative flippase GtrA